MSTFVAKSFIIPNNELVWRFIRATGPGEQKVNKVASAVQLHFNVLASKVLPADVKTRLINLGGNRINKYGEFVITAKCFRTQHANREDALQRLYKFVHRAQQVSKKRYVTKPRKSVLVKNKQLKQKQSQKKQQRKFSIDC